MKVLVIGAGNMGLTYAEAIAKSNYLRDRDLMILDNSEKKTSELKKKSHFDVYENLEDCLPKCDVILIAVKPYHADDLMRTMRPLMAKGQIVISLMAGVTIKAIKDGLAIKKVVRAMPNLPAQVGKGLTSFTASEEVSRLELSTIENLLDTTGRSVRLDSENDVDASTGISGSGPAYIFYFMQSMLEAAQKMGFSDHDSRVLVGQTFEGAVELFNKSDLDPNAWMDRVASKGGTTRAALDSMDDNNVKDLIQEAAYAAFNRAVELGKNIKMPDKRKKRVVIKVGTNVMVNKDNRIVGPILKRLVHQIAELYEQDVMSVLVSSGSVIAGKEVMSQGLSVTDKTTRRQVLSAVGQPRMMRHYYSMFHDYGMRCAQVLATKRDFDAGPHRENMINCYEGLLSEGVIPIANEDDAVSLSMSMFTDNDELASLVAELIGADMLILLTDTDGLYDGHPEDEDSSMIKHVTTDQEVEQYIHSSEKGEAEGRGGMESKLSVAKRTAAKNIPTFIANGKRQDVILDIVAGKEVGTRITAETE